MEKISTYVIGGYQPEDSVFDYVKQVADRVLPVIKDYTNDEGVHKVMRSSSLAPSIFCDRLNDGRVSMAERRYFYDEESGLQDMIRARSLDPDKLWALIVWLKDYVVSLHEIITDSPTQELMKIRQMLMRGAEKGVELNPHCRVKSP